MKNERKPKPPVIAAHAEKKNGHKSPPSKAKSNGRKTPSPRVPRNAGMDVSTLPLQNPYPVMRLAHDGQPLFGNQAAETLLGFSVDQSIPEHWREMVRSTLEAGSSREMDIEHNGRIFSALFVPVQQAGYVNIYCSDRTALYQTQESLRSSEERFRQAADAAGALVYEVDLLSGATAIVHGLERVAGYDPESSAPTSDWWHSIIHPDDLPLYLAQLEELMNRGGTGVCEYRLLHKSGNWINVQDNRLVIQNESGESVRLIGTVTDVTGRKHLEQNLRAREAELQDLIDQTPFMLTRCSRDLRYQFVSRTYAEMLGRKPEDVAGRPIVEIMGEAGLQTISPYVERVLNGERVEYEAEIPFRDAGPRWLHMNYTPEHDAQGNVVGWFAAITDVSTRRAAEQERNRALQREQWQREVAEQAWVVAEDARGKAEQELSERKLAEAALGTWADAPLSQETRPAWLRYGIALVVTAIAILLRQLLDPLLGDTVQYTLLFGALTFSVWYGGVGPSLLALFAGYIGITWLVLGWQQIMTPTPTTITSLIIFLFSSLVVIALGEAMKRAQRHAHQSAGVAVRRQRDAEFRLIEQQRTEQDLRASEQRFRDIFESSGVSVWVEDFSNVKMLIEDLRGQGVTDFHAYFTANPEVVRQAVGMINVLDVNQGTLDLYHASSKEQLLGPLSAMFTPDTERGFVNELAALADGQEMYRSEKQTQTLDGQPISILFTIHFNPLSNDFGRVIVTITDITERKQMEEELARERELFKRLFETMPVMSTIYDPVTQTLLMNKHIQELTGWKQDEVTVESLLHALYPDPVYMQDVLGRMAAAAGTGEWVEVRICTRDGRVLDTLWANTSIMQGEKIVTGISLGIDITERKRMADTIRESEERYRAIVSQATAGIAESDLESGIVFANPRFCEMLGYTEAELLGKTIWELTYTDDLEQNQHLFNQMMTGGQAYQFEKRFIRRDGSHLWANVSVSPIHDLSGRPRGGVGVIIDIGERKRAEQATLDYARQQAALFKLAERLQNAYAPDAIYDAALDAILEALHCDRASILLFDESERMRFVAWSGLSDAYRTATDGHSPWTKEEIDPQPIYIDDIETSDLSDELKSVIRQEGIGALAFIPLVPNGQMIGKFMVYFDRAHTFTDSELDLALTIGRQLAFDIARKRAEKQVRASREWLNQIIETVQAMISIFDVNGKLLMINSAGAKIFGTTPEEMVGKTLYDLYPPEFAASRIQLYRGMIEAGEMQNYDIQVPADDGPRWYRVALSPMIDPVTGKSSLLSAAIDITERKQAEDEIMRLNAELQSQLDEMTALMDILPTGVWIGNADCSVITGNPAAYQIMGLKPGTNASLTVPHPQTPAGLQIFVNSEEVQPEQAPMQQVAKTGKPLFNIEHELWFANGIRKSVYASIVPLFDQKGQVRKVIGAYTDISERKHWEDELRRSADYDAFRVRLADALRQLNDPETILSASLRMLGEKLNVDRVIYSEIEEDDETIVVLGNYVKDDVPEITGRSSLRDYGKAGDVFRRGEDLVINDTLTSADLDERDQTMFTALGIRSAVGIPVIKGNRWAATLGVHHGESRPWSRHEIALIVETAERTWATMERARSQAALRASEALYRTIARSIPGGGVYVVDKDMRYLVAEGPVTEAFGLSRQMLEGRTVMDVFPDERGAKMQERLHRTFAGETVDYETIHEGRVYWTQQAPVQDSIGRAIILTLDITERKRAEEELRNARVQAEQTAGRIARLQQITSALASSFTSEQLSELILEQGTRASGAAAGMMVEVVNQGRDVKTVAALGYPAAAIPAEPSPLSDKTPISDAIRTKQAIWLASHEEFAAQYPELADLRRGFGDEAVVVLPLIVDDRPIGCLSFGFGEKRNFLLEERGFLLALAQQCAQGLERVRAAEALRESEQRFAGFMQHLPGLAWIKDIDGRYVFVNDAAEKAFRVSRTELYGHTDAEVFPPGVADQFRRNDEQALLEGRGIQVVEELQHQDGTRHYSLVNKFPIVGSDGAVTLIGGMAIDITERKQAEERLALLAQISELIRDTEDAAELMSAVADVVGRHMQARRCLFNEIDVENDVEVVHHDYHDGVDSVAGIHRITEYSSITSADMVAGPRSATTTQRSIHALPTTTNGLTCRTASDRMWLFLSCVMDTGQPRCGSVMTNPGCGPTKKLPCCRRSPNAPGRPARNCVSTANCATQRNVCESPSTLLLWALPCSRLTLILWMLTRLSVRSSAMSATNC